MGVLATPVQINGTVCRNCYDVDWARKAEAEDTKKRDAETAKKTKEETGQTSILDNQPVTTLDGSLKGASRVAAASAPVAPPPTDTPGQSVNIYA
jgi:hypothetical protein